MAAVREPGPGPVGAVARGGRLAPGPAGPAGVGSPAPSMGFGRVGPHRGARPAGLRTGQPLSHPHLGRGAPIPGIALPPPGPTSDDRRVSGSLGEFAVLARKSAGFAARVAGAL